MKVRNIFKNMLLDNKNNQDYMICGVVDVGSNTIRLSIYRCGDGRNSLLLHRKVTAGLVSYVEDGALPEDGIRVVCRTLCEFRELLDTLGIEKMYTFATASLRNITNTDEVISAVKERTGLDIDVISGEEEAELSYRGARQDTENTAGLMVDLGGGSTEILRYEDGRVLSSCSIPIGSLSAYSRFVNGFKPTAAERKAIRDEIRERLSQCGAEFPKTEHILGVGGTVRAACRAYNRIFKRDENINTLTRDELKELLKVLKKSDKPVLCELLKAVPERVLTIVPGLVILNTIMDAYRVTDITVGRHGVREGYLHKKVLEED